ncbi:MAG: hypothetical protein ACEQSA_05170 [Weeksellaceae bacterium]
MKSVIQVIGIFFIFVCIYSFNITDAYHFDNDFARDLVEIQEITRGDLRLIGPGATFGGLKTSPYYYYLFAPILALSSFSISAMLIFQTLLFAGAISFFFHKSKQKYSLIPALLATCVIGFSPFMLLAARSPGNAFTYISLLMVLLTYIHFYDIKHPLVVSIIGFVMGIVVTTHYSNLILILPVGVLIWHKLTQKKYIWLLLVGFVVALTPLILFELKHDFVMFRNTFIDKSYVNFLESKQLAGAETAKQNIFENIIFISQRMYEYLGVHPFVLMLILTIAYYYSRKNKTVLLHLVTVTIAYVTVIILLRSQFAMHYLFPLMTFLLFSTVLVLLSKKQTFIGFILVILILLHFPKGLYSDSSRPYTLFEARVAQVLQQRLVSTDTRFNILQVRPDTIIVPHGYEYRFFFEKAGVFPQKVDQYAQSDTLLIFSEITDYDLDSLRNWEIEQFGRENLSNAKKTQLKDITVYRLSK